MKNWWRTDEELMNNWWRADEQLMNSWWTADEQLMNWWWTDDELMNWSGLPKTTTDYHRLPQTTTDCHWLPLTDWFYSIEHSKAISGIGWDGMGWIHLRLTPPTTRAPLAVLIRVSWVGKPTFKFAADSPEYELVNCPTRWSLSFIFVFLCWSSTNKYQKYKSVELGDQLPLPYLPLLILKHWLC